MVDPLEPPARPDARPVLGSFLGMGGLACMLFVVLFSGVAPWWAVVLLTVVWLVLLGAGVRWFMQRPWWVATLPVVMAAVWVATVVAGVRLLDWNA